MRVRRRWQNGQNWPWPCWPLLRGRPRRCGVPARGGGGARPAGRSGSARGGGGRPRRRGGSGQGEFDEGDERDGGVGGAEAGGAGEVDGVAAAGLGADEVGGQIVDVDREAVGQLAAHLGLLVIEVDRAGASVGLKGRVEVSAGRARLHAGARGEDLLVEQIVPGGLVAVPDHRPPVHQRDGTEVDPEADRLPPAPRPAR